MKIAWWQWLPFWRWRTIGSVSSADEVPQRLPRNAIVLVGDLRHIKWIVFDCPCRTGHRIMLNSDPVRRPYWTLNASSRLGIYPSVDYRGTDRRCHYFVRNGKIIWTKDSDR
ncbi:DUF6527 family protein [Methylocystis iwaonis]|uniref:DUF6527 family protein n=1 Tax=Methylocystis iwaonis TaxID=2885079 RepID=UPI0033142B2B